MLLCIYFIQFEFGENLDRSTDDLTFPTPSGTTVQQAEALCKVSNLIILLHVENGRKYNVLMNLY